MDIHETSCRLFWIVHSTLMTLRVWIPGNRRKSMSPVWGRMFDRRMESKWRRQGTCCAVWSAVARRRFRRGWPWPCCSCSRACNRRHCQNETIDRVDVFSTQRKRERGQFTCYTGRCRVTRCARTASAVLSVRRILQGPRSAIHPSIPKNSTQWRLHS